MTHDRLREIKDAREKYRQTHYGDKLTTKQIDWLIQEVERLRWEVAHVEEMRIRDFKEAR